jgi:hypothetical protein
MARKDDVTAWECSSCGEIVYPEEIMEGAMQSVSGHDVVTVVHCECGQSALLSYTVSSWNKMHKKRKAQMGEETRLEEQRRNSMIGREVAEFARKLETVDTLEEMGLA